MGFLPDGPLWLAVVITIVWRCTAVCLAERRGLVDGYMMVSGRVPLPCRTQDRHTVREYTLWLCGWASEAHIRTDHTTVIRRSMGLAFDFTGAMDLTVSQDLA